MFSVVEHLAFQNEAARSDSSEEHDGFDRTERHKLLRSFRNVKALRIDNGPVEDLAHCLEL